MDVHYKVKLVVTVCAIVYTSGEGMESRVELISGASCQGTISAHCIPTPNTHLGYVPGLPIAHQQLEEEVRWIDALGDDVVARGVLQTQPPTSPGVDRCSTYTPGAMLVSLICLLLGDYGASD